MRNLVFSLLCSSFAIGYGQIPVTDAATNANLGIISANIAVSNSTLAEILTIQTAAKGEAVQTTTNTMNTLKEAEKVREMLVQVNSAVSQGKMVEEIFNTSKSIIDITFNMQKTLNSTSLLDSDTKNSFINQSTDLMNESQPLLEIANKVLSSGVFKANDMERVNTLMDIKKELDQIFQKLKVFRYHSITINGIDTELNNG